MAEQVCLIANPASGRGRGARALPAARSAFEAIGVRDVRLTMAAGDEARLTRAAIADGVTTLAVLGGDGTWSKVASAIVRSGAPCRLALLASGTGNDFAKSVGTPSHDYAQMAQMCVAGGETRVDMGSVGDDLFLNVAGFGFDAAVLEVVDRIDWLRGDALYLYASLRQLFGYRGVSASVLRDGGREDAMALHLAIIVANGRHFGGAFEIAPTASIVDGRLDLVTIGAASSARRLRIFGAAMRGRHVALTEVHAVSATRITVRFERPPAYEIDGELRHAATTVVDVACIPGALRVVTAIRSDGAAY